MIDVKKVLQATTVVTLLTLGVKGLGFVEKVLLAYFYGTGIQVDAYLVAYSIPFSAFIVLRDVIEPAFLPTFVRVRHESAAQGRLLFSVVGAVLLALLGAATLAGMLAADPLIAIAAPGFGGEQHALAVRLTRLALPALLALGLSTLTTAVLHAQKRFALPALGEASFRAGPLILLLAVGGIQGLALGVLAGALVKLVIEGLGLGRWLRRDPDCREAGHQAEPAMRGVAAPARTVGRLALPLLFALTLSLFVGPLVENAFASRAGVGGVSALAYARKIAETLTTILPYALAMVLLPFSAEMVAGQDYEALARTLTSVVRVVMLTFLPITLGVMALREPLVRLLFERGAFTAASTQLTAGPLLFYGVALLPFALEVVVIQFFFARQDTLTPVLADVVTFGLNVALIPPLMGALGLGGIALAAALAKAAKVLALLLLFGRRVPAFRIASFGPFVGRLGLASLVSGAALLAFASLVRILGESLGLIGLLACLVAGGLLGGGLFALAAHLLQIAEIHLLWSGVRRWWQRWARRARRCDDSAKEKV